MRTIILSTAILLLTSCAQTTIYPIGKDEFSSVSTSSNQGYAEQDAKAKAETHCNKLGKRLQVINHQTRYRGPDAQTKMVGGVVSGLTGGPNSAVSENDYEVRMLFKCV